MSNLVLTEDGAGGVDVDHFPEAVKRRLDPAITDSSHEAARRAGGAAGRGSLAGVREV